MNVCIQVQVQGRYYGVPEVLSLSVLCSMYLLVHICIERLIVCCPWLFNHKRGFYKYWGSGRIQR